MWHLIMFRSTTVSLASLVLLRFPYLDHKQQDIIFFVLTLNGKILMQKYIFLQEKCRLSDFNKISVQSTDFRTQVPNIIRYKKLFQWQHSCSMLTNKRQEGHEAAKSCCSQYFANTTKNSRESNQTNAITSTVGLNNVWHTINANHPISCPSNTCEPFAFY